MERPQTSLFAAKLVLKLVSLKLHNWGVWSQIEALHTKGREYMEGLNSCGWQINTSDAKFWEISVKYEIQIQGQIHIRMKNSNTKGREYMGGPNSCGWENLHFRCSVLRYVFPRYKYRYKYKCKQIYKYKNSNTWERVHGRAKLLWVGKYTLQPVAFGNVSPKLDTANAQKVFGWICMCIA